MRTDDALAVARWNRLAPQKCIQVEIVAAKGARGEKPKAEAEALFGQDGVAISYGTRADIHGCLVDHGVAFAQCVWTPREDGSRTDVEVRYWPIEHVRWDSHLRCYVTRVDASTPSDEGFMGEAPIVHGDGRWIIFSGHDFEPHNQDAAIIAGSLIWARHAYAIRDWSKGSVAHGSAKVIGKMAEGVPLQSAEGGLSDEAAAFAALLRAVATSDSACGIAPAGSEVEFLVNNSTAWQVWTELVNNAEKAAARLYLGTDGTLGSQGGAPGVDVEAMFGVASTKVEGDLKAISLGLQTGVIEVWCALNFGDSSLAPTRRYMIPDADADADAAAAATRDKAFQAHIKEAKDNGFVVDQEYVDAAATTYGVAAPKLPEETEAKVPTIALAPTDLAGVVSVNEARSSAGLGPLLTRDGAEDPDGFITVGEYKAKKEAIAKPAAPVAAPAPALRRV
jgi:hypothetical protein